MENTRRLLTEIGVSALADAVVLSCEVGWAAVRPSACLWDVAAGFEIWSDGAGLATRSFSLNP